ncbi:HAMP domain-containing histidine kinase [Defluviimonas sp. WL0050]|uniref:histidine kinase n=1 Tax=Albidovulum litorale TaxID=2984134 RepID=A0ABT2ZRZ2_9RHOB|nr:HAMP domain-containing sensor histidine kinase [Defluviimonas sp. WL0050]MCV2873921.1 HAMP domain-containing histidine kinase [Defluviimonas sp. WL0050]
MRSLRQRAIVGGLLWAGLIIAIGGVALFYYFDALSLHRFDTALRDRYLQVVAALGNSGGDADAMEGLLTDPAYQRTYSGRYWQVIASDGEAIASRSLFDTLLDHPQVDTIDPDYWNGPGPEGHLRGIASMVQLDDGTAWTVAVAESLDSLDAERSQIRQSLLTTFAFIGALGVAGAMLQMSAVIRPLNKLRKDVAHRWDSNDTLDPADYPDEVAPLVTDINTLLHRNREIVERGRRQAADLAHALRTPTAILRNELDALTSQGIELDRAHEALDRVDAQLQRSLARIRAENTGATTKTQTRLSKSVDRLARLFRSMPNAKDKSLKVDLSDRIHIPMDAQDLEEILGNTLENAFKWARKAVRVIGGESPDDIWFAIEDDGPGIPEESRREALRSGGRLDTSMPGTGLGLAIAADLMHAYGGRIALSQSEDLGGLRVTFSVPARRGLGASETE